MWEWEITHSDEEEEEKKHIAIILLSTGFGESYCQLGDEIDESDESDESDGSDSDNYIDDTNSKDTYRRSIFTVANMSVGKARNNKLV